jgi:broad-specificity NMP kinase
VLKRRLARRGYGARKLNDNITAELLDYCTQRVEQEYLKRPLELDTSRRTVAASATALAQAVRQKKKKLDAINYSKQLIQFARGK